MGDRPLIGVTTSEIRLAENVRQVPEGEPPRREMALGLTYLRAIEAGGGLPVVIPPLELPALRPLLSRLSGLCLSGGPDLDPTTYGARSHHKLGPTEPQLDRFEIALARRAYTADLPILGICRGAQALNVATGGTLRQHLAGPPSTLEHRQSEPPDQATHRVRVQEGTLLASVLGDHSCMVNSFHHQASKRIGRGLRAVAWSDDGVIEGLEAPRRAFVLGVQWHAECLAVAPAQAALFAALVDAAQSRAEGRTDARVA